MKDYSRMSSLDKPPRAKPTANASNYLADLKARIDMLSPKEESDIRTRFFTWMNDNRKLGFLKSAEEKRNKFFEIADTILTLSRSEGFLFSLTIKISTFSNDFSNIPWNIPEDARFEWMVEKEIKSPKKLDHQSHPPVKEEKSSNSVFIRTLRRIFITDIIIHNYLYGPYKN